MKTLVAFILGLSTVSLVVTGLVALVFNGGVLSPTVFWVTFFAQFAYLIVNAIRVQYRRKHDPYYMLAESIVQALYSPSRSSYRRQTRTRTQTVNPLTSPTPEYGDRKAAAKSLSDLSDSGYRWKG